jgi:minimal PKS acyl carrier protein
MPHNIFSVDDLMDLLVRKVGLPEEQRTDRTDVLFTDLGLDSLAFLELQSQLSRAYGVELPDDRAHVYTTGDIVAEVRLGASVEAAS